MIPRIVLYVVAALLIGAHFLRQGNLIMTAACLIVPMLFFYRRLWSLIVLQVAAYVSAGTWAVILVQIVQQRLAQGRPWTTGAIILGAVIVLTIAAGALLNSRVITDRYPR